MPLICRDKIMFIFTLLLMEFIYDGVEIAEMN